VGPRAEATDHRAVTDETSIGIEELMLDLVAPREIGDSASVPPHLTDMGNARRLVMRHGDTLRFVPEWGEWLVWDGSRWALEAEGRVMQRAKDTVLAMYTQVSKIQDDAKRGQLRTHAGRSETLRALKAMVALAQTEPELTVRVNDLDADPYLFNVANGTLDLRTGKLNDHRPGDLLTMRSPVTFDPTAACPLFKSFLVRIFEGNHEVMGWLQRLVGYALIGEVVEEVLPFFWGMGANGKSTLARVLLALFGEYGSVAAPELLLDEHSHPTLIADLRGRRLVVGTESGEGRRLNEVKVNWLTGGDRLKARRMHQDSFEFNPSHTFMLAGNYRPDVRGQDHAIWRRVKLVPFTVTIPEEDQDRQLTSKLLKELPGILAWAVRGCLDWHSKGLATPAVIRDATEDYRNDCDPLADFLADMCVIGDDQEVLVSTIYQRYGKWCSARDAAPMSSVAFGRQLGRRFRPNRSSKARSWVGVGLR
jgi:putative DNA primase/helicase